MIITLTWLYGFFIVKKTSETNHEMFKQPIYGIHSRKNNTFTLKPIK